MGDVAEPHRAPDREDVHPQRDLVAAAGRRLEVDLALQPLAGPLGQGDPSPLGVDAGAGEHRGGDRVQPRLRVGPLVDVPGVLLARRVAVAGPPASVGPAGDADHRQTPTTLLQAPADRGRQRSEQSQLSARSPQQSLSSHSRPTSANHHQHHRHHLAVDVTAGQRRTAVP